MTMIISEARLADVMDEVKELAPLHHAELAVNQGDIELDIDWDFYVGIDAMGALAGYTVRTEEGKLVGYASYVVRKHPRYRPHLWGTSDVFWVHPDYRDGKIGNALFAFIEASLKAKGVSVMHTTFKVAHPAPGLLLRRRGHVMIEHGYSKRLR